MSATEVIELIKKLPPEQQAEVRIFVNRDEGAEGSPVRYIPTGEFEKIAPKIFEDNRELLRRLAQ